MPRFTVGERVKILPVMESAFSNIEGVIDEIKPHERGVTTLDRYVVQFTWGEKQLFYDAQLERSSKRT